MKHKELLKQIAVMNAYAAVNIEYPAWDWINNNYREKNDNNSNIR